MSRSSSWRSVVTCVVLAPFASSCSLLFVQPLKPDNDRRHPSLQCTSSNIAPTLDMIIAGWQVVRIVSAAGAEESDYRNSGLSQEGDIALGMLFGALAIGSAIYGFSSTEECRAAGGVRETRRPGHRKPSVQEEMDEEAAAEARAATLANMAAQQAQAAGIAANKAAAAAGPATAGTPP